MPPASGASVGLLPIVFSAAPDAEEAGTDNRHAEMAGTPA